MCLLLFPAPGPGAGLCVLSTSLLEPLLTQVRVSVVFVYPFDYKLSGPFKMSVKISSDIIKPFTGEGELVAWLKKVKLVAKLQKISDLASFLVRAGSIRVGSWASPTSLAYSLLCLCDRSCFFIWFGVRGQCHS